MSTRARVAAVGLVAASLVLLAGCVSEPVYPTGMTDAEAQALMQREADAQWEYLQARFPDAERPPADSIVVHDEETYWEAFIACLDDAGFEQTLAGGIELTPEEQEEFELAQGLCGLQHQLDPRDLGLLGPSQLEYLYDYFTAVSAPCLRLLGYEVHPAPSKDEFVAQNGWAWNPYESIYLASTMDTRHHQYRCPRLTEPPFSGYFP